MNKRRGFTLIELLVVIAIIGILSSIVLASLNSARQSSRDARRISDIKQFQLALELYFDDNSASYPSSLDSLAPTYIATTSTDPQGNVYTYEGYGTQYCVGITLEDNNHSATDSSSSGCLTTLGGTINYAVSP